jgi:hypothetical protein
MTAPAHRLQPSPPLSRGLPFTLDLETIKYFHHFTTTTSLTLPDNTQNHHSPAKHWQVDVVAQALEVHWLMCGLLAISASHLAALSDHDEMSKLGHLERAAQFRQEFSGGWGEVKHGSQVAGAHPEEANMKTGAQMACIHRCCRWVSEPEMESSSELGGDMEQEPALFQLHSFIQTIRGCGNPEFALRSTVGSTEMLPEETPNDHSMTDVPSQLLPGAPGAPSALLERIRTLPHRMHPLGKPDNALDFFATLSAIDTLVECCSLSYTAYPPGDEIGSRGAAWRGMESWLARVPAHFGQMVARKSHAALVVLAHWSVLVERAEHQGCWFLRGAAGKVRRLAARGLPQDGVVQGLIENLEGY